MNTTTYPSRVRSPIQTMRDESLNLQSERHPVRQMIQKNLGSRSLTIEFKEDVETIRSLNDVSGLIAIRCELRWDGKTVAIGRGQNVLSKSNRWIERNINGAFHSSLIDAVAKSARIYDLLNLGGGGIEAPYQSNDSEDSAITSKQEQYLRQLVTEREEEDTREQLLQQLPEMTKSEASALIAQYKS